MDRPLSLDNKKPRWRYACRSDINLAKVEITVKHYFSLSSRGVKGAKEKYHQAKFYIDKE